MGDSSGGRNRRLFRRSRGETLQEVIDRRLFRRSLTGDSSGGHWETLQEVMRGDSSGGH